MKSIRRLFAIFVCLLLLSVDAAPKKRTTTSAPSNNYVEPLTHDISIITPKNYDAQIQKYRDRFPAALLFYTKVPESRKFINDVWDPVAKKLKGMVKVGAVDCDEYADFCKSHEVMANPHQIKLLPPLPRPEFVWDKETTVEKLSATLAKMVPPGQITKIENEQEMSAFVGTHAALPKVMLFSDKKKPSALFNALSNTFSDRMNFAFISGGVDNGLFKKFHVKKTPTLILKKGDLSVSVKGSQTYRGEMNFHNIHEWINVHSETFVKGGGFLTEKEPEAQNITDIRPWLLDRIPEITKASHHDVCFKKGKGLCAIYLTPHEQLKPEELQMLENLATTYNAETKPGFHWSWMNLGRETNFAKLFNMESAEEPSLAVFNPHSRLRFSKLPQVADASSISAFIDKIVSGDGRFTVVKGNRVPAFVGKKKKQEEL